MSIVTIDQDRWMRPVDAARRLGITETRVAQLRRSGRLDILETPFGYLIGIESVERRRLERSDGSARKEAVATR